MSIPTPSKYFEILSHPIRFSIISYIDINTRNYSQIMEGISSEEKITSSKLNFHLKKLIKEEIVNKDDKSYSVTELGLKLLSLSHYFGELDFDEHFDENSGIQSEIEGGESEAKHDLPLIKKIDGLPLLVSVFEYFEGKNYDFMEENYSLTLTHNLK